MSEQRLDRSNIGASLQQVCGKRVAECVDGGVRQALSCIDR